MEETIISNEQFLKVVKSFMVLSGTWKLQLKITRSRKDHYHYYTMCFQGIFVIFLTLLFVKLIQLLIIQANLDAIYSNLAIMVSSFAVGVKIVIYQRNNVPQMFRNILEEELKILLSDDEEIKLFYSKQVKYCRKINLGIMIYVFFAMGSLFLVSLLTFIQEDTNSFKTDKEQLEEYFMYPFWLPYKEKSNIISVILLNILFAVVGIILYCASHMISATLMIFAATQLKILQIRIGNLTFDNDDQEDTINAYNNLRSFSARHSLLIKFINKLNDSIKYIMMMDFTLNSLNVASVAIQVLTMKTLKGIVFPVSYLGVLVLQVFVLGWLANEIKIQSVAIGDALFTINWYNQSIKIKNMVLIIMLRTQKPLMMNIGPFGAMTTETALRTMQAAYSYITLMQNYK